MTADQYCKKFTDWANVCMADLPTDGPEKRAWRQEFRDKFQFFSMAIYKSNLLSRLLYFNEEVRTVQCPLHMGVWSGCHPEPCPHGCHYTGWLPTSTPPGDSL